MYADDLILISISVTDLQQLLNMCADIFKSLDLPINASKSHCIRIGPRHKSPCKPLMLNDTIVSWVDKIKYLGIFICNHSNFKCDWREAKSKFYVTSNIIFGKLGANPPVEIALKLFMSQCLPSLTYGNVATGITRDECNKLSFVFNSIFVKLFNVKDKNNLLLCQYYTGVLSFELQYEFNRFLFLRKLIDNDLLCEKIECDEMDLQEFVLLKSKFSIHDFASVSFIKTCFWNFFEKQVLLI